MHTPRSARTWAGPSADSLVVVGVLLLVMGAYCPVSGMSVVVVGCGWEGCVSAPRKRASEDGFGDGFEDVAHGLDVCVLVENSIV